MLTSNNVFGYKDCIDIRPYCPVCFFYNYKIYILNIYTFQGVYLLINEIIYISFNFTF